MPEATDTRSQKTMDDYPSDLEARDEARGIFRDLVKTSFDPRDIEKWVRASPIRQSLFDDVAVGQIRWPRALGRPDAPSLFDGFVITTKFWADVWHVGLDGSVVVDLGWTPGLPPDLREDVSKPDEYCVRYLFHASENDNQVEVQFADMDWHRPGRALQRKKLYLSSHGYVFQTGGAFMTLPEITVDDRPFFHA
jgi:hypothetical protein